jgi:restriction system protein
LALLWTESHSDRIRCYFPGVRLSRDQTGSTIRIVDQVKRYAPHRKVIANDVRALAGVLLRDRDVSKGIVTTTSDFAPGIQKEFAPLMPSRIELKNGQVLKEWLNELYSRGKA